MNHRSRLSLAALCLVSISLIGAGCSGSVNNDVSPSEDGVIGDAGNLTSITRQAALDKYWYFIAPYINGTETVEAYSASSGSTYNIDATFSGGFLDSLDNGYGDTLNFTAELKADGNAHGEDNNGSTWDINVDIDNSPMITDAVEAWAAAKGYQVE